MANPDRDNVYVPNAFSRFSPNSTHREIARAWRNEERDHSGWKPYDDATKAAKEKMETSWGFDRWLAGREYRKQAKIRDSLTFGRESGEIRGRAKWEFIIKIGLGSAVGLVALSAVFGTCASGGGMNVGSVSLPDVDMGGFTDSVADNAFWDQLERRQADREWVRTVPLAHQVKYGVSNEGNPLNDKLEALKAQGYSLLEWGNTDFGEKIVAVNSAGVVVIASLDYATNRVSEYFPDVPTSVSLLRAYGKEVTPEIMSTRARQETVRSIIDERNFLIVPQNNGTAQVYVWYQAASGYAYKTAAVNISGQPLRTTDANDWGKNTGTIYRSYGLPPEVLEELVSQCYASGVPIAREAITAQLDSPREARDCGEIYICNQRGLCRSKTTGNSIAVDMLGHCPVGQATSIQQIIDQHAPYNSDQVMKFLCAASNTQYTCANGPGGWCNGEDGGSMLVPVLEEQCTRND